jgi:hypothetical protein
VQNVYKFTQQAANVQTCNRCECKFGAKQLTLNLLANWKERFSFVYQRHTRPYGLPTRPQAGTVEAHGPSEKTYQASNAKILTKKHGLGSWIAEHKSAEHT